MGAFLNWISAVFQQVNPNLLPDTTSFCLHFESNAHTRGKFAYSLTAELEANMLPQEEELGLLLRKLEGDHLPTPSTLNPKP